MAHLEAAFSGPSEPTTSLPSRQLTERRLICVQAAPGFSSGVPARAAISAHWCFALLSRARRRRAAWRWQALLRTPARFRSAGAKQGSDGAPPAPARFRPQVMHLTQLGHVAAPRSCSTAVLGSGSRAALTAWSCSPSPPQPAEPRRLGPAEAAVRESRSLHRVCDSWRACPRNVRAGELARGRIEMALVRYLTFSARQPPHGQRFAPQLASQPRAQVSAVSARRER